MKYFFLYTELADYTMQCFQFHLEKHPSDEIHVLHYPVNKEAPFLLQSIAGLHLYTTSNVKQNEVESLIKGLNPQLIICSGWGNSIYNAMVSKFKKTTTAVLAMDNVYSGTFKQRLLLLFSRYYLPKRFKFLWVPGNAQLHYGLKLGFIRERIHIGFYATNTSRLEQMYAKNRSSKAVNFPKVFLCVGRYIPEKGLNTLWQAFSELYSDGFQDWELWNVGIGEMFEQRVEYPGIKHLGFIQPSEFEHLIEQAGVFVLPSLSEPWGVAVNEFAAAGLPLLLSNKVGSGEQFLRVGENGYRFEAGNVQDLKARLKIFTTLNSEKLSEMSAVSHSLGVKVNAGTWSDTLQQIAMESQRK